jgi:hypothetical protein
MQQRLGYSDTGQEKKATRGAHSPGVQQKNKTRGAADSRRDVLDNHNSEDAGWGGGRAPEKLETRDAAFERPVIWRG